MEKLHLKYLGEDVNCLYTYIDNNGKFWKMIEMRYSREVCQRNGIKLYGVSGNVYDGDVESYGNTLSSNEVIFDN